MKSLEQDILRFLKARNWDKLRPVDLSKSIMIEAAELLELFQWENKELEEVKKDKNKIKEIEGELADVFIYALDLSVSLGIDTEQMIRKKLRKVEKKYPARLFKSSTVAPGTDREYWRIKKEKRK